VLGDGRLRVSEEKEGVRLTPESPEDLWYLKNVLRRGDLVEALTTRRERTREDSLRPEEERRVKVRLTVEVEEVEFHPFTERLRVRGLIREGMDVGRYHTLNVEPGVELFLKRELTGEEREFLKEAGRGGVERRALFISVDDEEILLFQVNDYGIKSMGSFPYPRKGKYYEQKEEGFAVAGEVLSAIREVDPEGVIPLVLLGPGFFKEKLKEELLKREEDLRGRLRTISSSSGGYSGVKEALRNPQVLEMLSSLRLMKELELLREFFERIPRGLAAYGKEMVERAIKWGAVETLLVTESHLHEGWVEEMFNLAREGGSEIRVISEEHEEGRMLEKMGGVGAILRYRIEG